jgi:hypothetical protein
MTDPAVETWVRFTHLDKLYGYLPGMAEALPAAHCVDPTSYSR